jgi:hypothetical protein
MTVGKISATCWTLFVVMCVLFAPALLAAIALHSVILAVGFVLLWWVPFGYAMYLAMAVTRNGDRRLLERGIPGTARVITARRTNEVIQEGEFAWEAPRVWKYELLVSIPGKPEYKTTCRICAAGIGEGQTVNVAVAKHNRKRVTIDVGQGRPGGAGRSTQAAPASTFSTGYTASRMVQDKRETESQRLSALTQLGQLHKVGVLTDAEFQSQKARILSE